MRRNIWNYHWYVETESSTFSKIFLYYKFGKIVKSKLFIQLGPVPDLKAFLACSRCNIFLPQLEKKNLARVIFFKSSYKIWRFCQILVAFSEYLNFNGMYLQVITHLFQLHFHPLPYWTMNHPQSLTIPKPDNQSNQFIMLSIILILPTMVRFDDFFCPVKAKPFQLSILKIKVLFLKYYSSTVAEGKTFILIFCNSA